VDVDAVEAPGELADGIVAPLSDLRKDGPYRLHDPRFPHGCGPRQGGGEVRDTSEVEPRKHPATVLSAAFAPRRGNSSRMDQDRAQLAPVATALDELTQRITVLAESYTATKDDQVATELYEIERSLQQAARRLDRLVRGR
ncbi:MAG: hypothetical protein QOG30_566, partial [Acidimicrobiaceae bacterium]